MKAHTENCHRACVIANRERAQCYEAYIALLRSKGDQGLVQTYQERFAVAGGRYAGAFAAWTVAYFYDQQAVA